MRLASYSPSWNDGSDLINRRPDDPRKSKEAATIDEIHRLVQMVLFPANPERRLPERRTEQRHPYPYPVHLTPVGRDGLPRVNETVVVIGRNLAAQGFDFYHMEPLPYRRVIASFATPSGGWLAFLLDLSWCRFGKHGLYDGGGRFLQAVASPMAQDPAA